MLLNSRQTLSYNIWLPSLPKVLCIKSFPVIKLSKCGWRRSKFGPGASFWAVCTVGGAWGQFEIQELLHTRCMTHNVPSNCRIRVWLYQHTLLPHAHRFTHIHLACIPKQGLFYTDSVFSCRHTLFPFIFPNVSGTLKLNPLVTFTAHLLFSGTGCDALGCTWQVSS